MNNIFETSIQKIEQENATISSIYFKPIPEPFKSANPGQYLLLQLFRDDKWTEFHPFTLTNDPEDDYLKLTVKRVGKFTTYLHALATPEKAQIRGPLGVFGSNIDDSDHLLFIAGGIGITPFISLLKHLEKTGSRQKITLFWANEAYEDLFYLDELTRYCKVLDMKVIIAVNSEEKNPLAGKYGFGWETGYLTREMMEKPIQDNTLFYICGSPNMQKYITGQLENLDISGDRINTENVGFFMKEG